MCVRERERVCRVCVCLHACICMHVYICVCVNGPLNVTCLSVWSFCLLYTLHFLLLVLNEGKHKQLLSEVASEVSIYIMEDLNKKWYLFFNFRDGESTVSI